jgi:dTMP kinase
MQGIFISFEGIDGAGKTTHIEGLVRAFTAQGRVVTQTREPGGTPLAEKLRAMVLNDAMDAMTEALLVFAARRDHIQQVIAPALRRGEVVLCDRFTDATFAYQGGGRGFDRHILTTLESWVQGSYSEFKQAEATGLLQPDITLWFDLPAQVAATRLASARVPDKFESQPQAFFEAVAQAYAERCAHAPKRFARINANQSVALVWADVAKAMQAHGYLPMDEER